MAKIKIKDLPKDFEMTKKEMDSLSGGLRSDRIWGDDTSGGGGGGYYSCSACGFWYATGRIWAATYRFFGGGSGYPSGNAVAGIRG